MSTARELLIVAMDMTSVRTVERGALSLALAGAEAIDLLAVGAITLEGDRIVPSDGSGTDGVSSDPLAGEALSSFVRQAPYESVGNWLWRRGRNLSAMYTAALEADGQLVRQHHRRWGCSGPANSSWSTHPPAAWRPTAGRPTSRSWPRSPRPSASATSGRRTPRP